MGYIRHCGVHRSVKTIYFLYPRTKGRYLYLMVRKAFCPRCNKTLMDWQGFGAYDSNGKLTNNYGPRNPIKHKHIEQWESRLITDLAFTQAAAQKIQKDTAAKPIVGDYTLLISRSPDRVYERVLKRH